MDHRRASFSQILPAEMAYLAEAVVSLDQTLGARHCAVISPDDGISKHAMYQFNVDPRADIVTQVFQSHQYEAALAWLDAVSKH